MLFVENEHCFVTHEKKKENLSLVQQFLQKSFFTERETIFIIYVFFMKWSTKNFKKLYSIALRTRPSAQLLRKNSDVVKICSEFQTFYKESLDELFFVQNKLSTKNIDSKVISLYSYEGFDHSVVSSFLHLVSYYSFIIVE